ncbi:MAG TPA: hypothetical protein VGH42_08655 [Verrucomicrobiae bacterium]
MTSESNVDRSAGLRRDADWLLAVLATIAVLALHLYFLNRVGGLERDEVNSVTRAQGALHNIAQDSFPILFPLLLRGWSALGLGGSDLALRCFGVLIGLGLATVFWLAAWWTRRAPPLWSLVLVALNAWVIYYAAWLRAYGLGSAMIALGAAAAWNFVQNPGRKSWLIFAATALLSVQVLYQNSVLVAAICAGACTVFLRQKKFKLIVAIFLAGLAAAVSLLPYWRNIAGMPQSAAPLRMDFDRLIALNDLDTLLAYPLPQFVWVWLLLAGFILLRAAAGLFSARGDDRSLFAAVTMVFGAALFWIFLKLANFPVQPWYFLPLVALAAVCLEAALPRPAGRFRAVLWGGLAAAAVVSTLFGVRLLDYRFTNVDLFAKKISLSAGKNDFVVVTPWQIGITFSRYFKNPCAWTTAPPIADHSCQRYDLLAAQMQNTNAMQPVLERIADTLRSGGTVWIVGGINEVDGPNLPASPPPPPASGCNETPYRFTWNNQLGWLLRHNSTNIESLDKGNSEDVNLDERVAFSKVTGWKN